jgi:hypothetical protein
LNYLAAPLFSIGKIIAARLACTTWLDHSDHDAISPDENATRQYVKIAWAGGFFSIMRHQAS